MTLSEEQYKRLQAETEKQAQEYGKNMAEWWWQDSFGGRGRGTKEQAEAILTGIDDGDPAVLDSLPACDFSGQWADGPDWDNEFADLMYDALKIDADDIDFFDADTQAVSDDMFQIYVSEADGAASASIESMLHELIAAK